MVPQLETRRLILRPLQLGDAEQAQRIFPHWEIVQYMHASRIPWPYPEDGSLTYYRDLALPATARGDEWHWSIRLRSDPDRLIGSISLRKAENANRGFWLGLPWHSQGLMCEAADAVTDYWFNVLGFPELRVAKAVQNISSRRISESSAMRIVGTEDRDYVGGRFATEIWAIAAEE